MFHWEEDDLVAVLEDCRFDVETAATRISEGHTTQWNEVKNKNSKPVQPAPIRQRPRREMNGQDRPRRSDEKRNPESRSEESKKTDRPASSRPATSKTAPRESQKPTTEAATNLPKAAVEMDTKAPASSASGSTWSKIVAKADKPAEQSKPAPQDVSRVDSSVTKASSAPSQPTAPQAIVAEHMPPTKPAVTLPAITRRIPAEPVVLPGRNANDIGLQFGSLSLNGSATTSAPVQEQASQYYSPIQMPVHQTSSTTKSLTPTNVPAAEVKPAVRYDQSQPIPQQVPRYSGSPVPMGEQSAAQQASAPSFVPYLQAQQASSTAYGMASAASMPQYQMYETSDNQLHGGQRTTANMVCFKRV